MGRRKSSAVWEFFKEYDVDDRRVWKFVLCKDVEDNKGNTFNLWSHLKNKKGKSGKNDKSHIEVHGSIKSAKKPTPKKVKGQRCHQSRIGYTMSQLIRIRKITALMKMMYLLT